LIRKKKREGVVCVIEVNDVVGVITGKIGEKLELKKRLETTGERHLTLIC
jgi:hypothetical protein